MNESKQINIEHITDNAKLCHCYALFGEQKKFYRKCISSEEMKNLIKKNIYVCVQIELSTFRRSLS